MSNMTKYPYIPDYGVPPGEVIGDYINELGMTQAELSTRTGMAKKTINEIIKGKSPITPETALKFERVLGRPAHVWNNLERQFQEEKIRLDDHQRLKKHLDWLKKVPVKEMIKYNWIQKGDTPIEQLEIVLQFFGVASPEQWKSYWLKNDVLYRQTDRFEKYPEAISAWLRKGEIDAQKIQCQPFHRGKFLNILNEIRHLTYEKPSVFIPRLQQMCASVGVAVVLVVELPKAGIWGATRWLGDKALIQLSLRYKSDDHLWFTFFHESGHLLKHGRKDLFIEGTESPESEKEKAADAFARDKLIPPSEYLQFLNDRVPTLSEIKHFARQIRIAPGIVVGRLQHDKILPRNQGNGLKMKLSWRKNQIKYH